MLNHKFYTEEELLWMRKQVAIQKNTLSPELIKFIHKKDWLKITIPCEEKALPWNAKQIAKLFESLSYVNGSLGWVVNLGAGANLFLAFIDSEYAQELKQNPKLWFAGSGAISGKAIKEEDGYRISGYWKYASGAPHATHFTCNAFIYDENGPILDKNREQVFKSFVIPASKVKIHETWNTMGLQASESHDFEVNDVLLDKKASFCISKETSMSADYLYQMPFDAFSIINISLSCSGIAMHFLELFEEEIINKKPLYAATANKENLSLLNLKDSLKNRFKEERKHFYELVDSLWEAVINKNLEAVNKLNLKIEQEALKFVQNTYDMLNILYRYCGMNTVFAENTISKVFADFMVASQHYLISPFQNIK